MFRADQVLETINVQEKIQINHLFCFNSLLSSYLVYPYLTVPFVQLVHEITTLLY